jgi:hypothetical protein
MKIMGQPEPAADLRQILKKNRPLLCVERDVAVYVGTSGTLIHKADKPSAH